MWSAILLRQTDIRCQQTHGHVITVVILNTKREIWVEYNRNLRSRTSVSWQHQPMFCTVKCAYIFSSRIQVLHSIKNQDMSLSIPHTAKMLWQLFLVIQYVLFITMIQGNVTDLSNGAYMSQESYILIYKDIVRYSTAIGLQCIFCSCIRVDIFSILNIISSCGIFILK